MTAPFPLNLDVTTCDAVILPFGVAAGPLPEKATGGRLDLDAYFALRADVLHEALKAVRADFEALIEGYQGDPEGLCGLGEAAHEHAEETDALLALLVRCKAPQVLIQALERTFDALRDLEEQISEVLEWDRGMGPRLGVLGSTSTGQASIV